MVIIAKILRYVKPIFKRIARKRMAGEKVTGKKVCRPVFAVVERVSAAAGAAKKTLSVFRENGAGGVDRAVLRPVGRRRPDQMPSRSAAQRRSDFSVSG